MVKTKQIIRRFSFDEWGGTETVVWNSTKKLIQNGHETEILATKALASTESETVENVPVRRFGYFYPYLNLKHKNISVLDKKGGNPYSFPLYKYLLKEKNIDLFHCHTMQRIANLVRLASKKKKIPYVISFHGGFFEVPESEIDEMMKPYKGTFNYGKIIDILLKKERYLDDASGIICVGHNEYLSAREKYPDKIVEYIPNGVDIDKFQKKTDNDFREKYKIPQGSQILLCVSRIDYQKNQIRIIELHNELKIRGEKVHTVLIGPVTSELYFEKIKSDLEDFSLQSEVTIIKGLEADDTDLINAYKSADFFILPSVHEPFGIVALEAWASKVPVIAHKVGGLQKLIKDGENGIFFTDDSLSELIEKFHQCKKTKEKLVKNAYKEVCNNYSWDTVCEKLMIFYEKVIKEYQSSLNS